MLPAEPKCFCADVKGSTSMSSKEKGSGRGLWLGMGLVFQVPMFAHVCTAACVGGMQLMCWNKALCAGWLQKQGGSTVGR